MDNLSNALFLLPVELRTCSSELVDAEEIRLRVGNYPSVIKNGMEQVLHTKYVINPEDLDGVVERATGASEHSVTEYIKNGYIPVPGGMRIGVCGNVVMQGDKPINIRKKSSVSIRIPHQNISFSDEIYHELSKNAFCNTIILSPPGLGKTTLLRELIRKLSNDGNRISLCDERNEVAGVLNGQATFDVGQHTDIMSDVPKRYAVLMLLRSMNPQIIAMDEITEPDDIKVAVEAIGCGVKILATAHASSVSEFMSRPLYRQLVKESVFSRAIVIKACSGKRLYSVEKII